MDADEMRKKESLKSYLEMKSHSERECVGTNVREGK